MLFCFQENQRPFFENDLSLVSVFQVPGSIPLLWEKIVDLSYKPRIKIISHEETPKAVERHFNDLKQRYGDVVVLDLTDKVHKYAVISREERSKYLISLFQTFFSLPDGMWKGFLGSSLSSTDLLLFYFSPFTCSH